MASLLPRTLCLLLLAALPSVAFAKDPSSRFADFPKVRSISKIAGDATLKSAGGREFDVIEFGTQTKAPQPTYRFLIQGGIHGNEEVASTFVLWLARRYARGESPLNELPKDEVLFDFLPYANPDGSEVASRYNGQGVNLNRNFGVLWGITKENPGKASFSENETRAIRALFAEKKYTAAVDVHGYINWIVTPSSPESLAARGIKVTAQQATAYRAWINDIREEVRIMPGYQLKTGALLGDGGAFEDWAFWTQGTFAYCLELETFQRFVPSYRDRADQDVANKEVVKVDLFKRYEMFIYRTFKRAIELKRQGQEPGSQVAGR